MQLGPEQRINEPGEADSLHLCSHVSQRTEMFAMPWFV